MSKHSDTIPKQPQLNPAEDYYLLRREGIGFVENMGSHLWTDYNTHDPGITILESLCYAITDLAYRTRRDIKDILTPETKSPDPAQPYPNQAFFTAREILTVNPCTTDDFRRILIDLDGIRNAWVLGKQGFCGPALFVQRDSNNRPSLTYQKPAHISEPEVQISIVDPKGLYDVLLELEASRELGDLNDRKIMQTFTLFDADNAPHSLTLELRFPAWELLEQAHFNEFIDSKALLNAEMLRFAQNKMNDSDFLQEDRLEKYWQGVFFTALKITLADVEDPFIIPNVSLRFYGDKFVRRMMRVKEQPSQYSIQGFLQETSISGFIETYRAKLKLAAASVNDARKTLSSQRNLDEDYCSIRVIGIEDIAVCADIEVKPDADIEHIQAQIWFEIEQYFNPPLPFHTLQELESAEVSTENIFNGPKLENGFLKTEELQTAKLKTVLRASDTINRLMDIEGILSVNCLSLTKYDSEGNAVKGHADPQKDTGKLDPNKISASWELYITEQHQPRFNRNLSCFLFFKNNLPFMPRMDEALDTLTQLRGQAERPRIKNALMDFPIPSGTFRNLEDYYPLQYSFPLTYGIGREGLPLRASAQRQAQAKQLKTYLMVFEQILGNALTQLAHTADLFSLDSDIDRTYFFKEFSETIIQGYSDLIDRLDQTSLNSITETAEEFYERRNRFLDHIMARFGEQFDEYALMLSNLQGQRVALKRLIGDKIAFMKAYPLITYERGKAFNYLENPCSSENIPGLKRRIRLLLGNPELSLFWRSVPMANDEGGQESLQLKDRNGQAWLEINPPKSVTAALNNLFKVAKQKHDPESCEVIYENGALKPTLKDKNCNPINPVSLLSTDQAHTLNSKLHETLQRTVIQIAQPNAFEILPEADQFRLKLRDEEGESLGQYQTLLKTKAEAQALQNKLLEWGANERMIIVEHLLLRPKFPGDALYSICTDSTYASYGNEDPYSFRLTIVMPGWAPIYNKNMEMREFTERTIRQEAPSHLLCKICWVSNDGFDGADTVSVINNLTQLLASSSSLNEVENPSESRALAEKIFTNFSKTFKAWYADKMLVRIQTDDLNKSLSKVFKKVNFPRSANNSLTTALKTDVRRIMVAYFKQAAIKGWQFERFEDAWCKWLETNAKIDWTEERLQERVEALLFSKVIKQSNSAGPKKDELSHCASAILAKFGTDFFIWMDAQFQEGKMLEGLDFESFNPDQIKLCEGLEFESNTIEALQELLRNRYKNYKEVSYRLKVVLKLLSEFHSVHPAATLHDSDEGNDQNPVRLGVSALGASAYPPPETL